MGLRADQLGKAGRVEEWLLAIAKALALAERTGEGHVLAELHRVKGELFFKSGD